MFKFRILIKYIIVFNLFLFKSRFFMVLSLPQILCDWFLLKLASWKTLDFGVIEFSAVSCSGSSAFPWLRALLSTFLLFILLLPPVVLFPLHLLTKRRNHDKVFQLLFRKYHRNEVYLQIFNFHKIKIKNGS